MDLFSNGKNHNLLPIDGTVVYYEKVLEPAGALFYFNRLMAGIKWKNDEVVIFGRHIITNRKTAWYVDKPYAYTYSGITRNALPWIPELNELKQLAANVSGTSFNSCLLNLYHNGNEGMAWHSDDEKTLVAGAAIASISLGAERKFSFKHKTTGQTVSLILGHGSLLVMKDNTQTNWLHSLPPSKKIKRPRINLTFRTML